MARNTNFSILNGGNTALALRLGGLMFCNESSGEGSSGFLALAALPAQLCKGLKVTSFPSLSPALSPLLPLGLFSPSSNTNLIQRLHLVIPLLFLFFQGFGELKNDVNSSALSFSG